MKELDKKKLEDILRKIDPTTQDYIEHRLHSHTVSSNKLILDRLDALSQSIESLKTILTDEKMATLLKMIKEYQNAEIVSANYEKNGKKVLKWGGFIIFVGSLIASINAIVRWLVLHIHP